MKKFGVSWSLRLTAEGGFVVALLVGLFVGNFLPGFADWMKEAVRPELYVKTAIVHPRRLPRRHCRGEAGPGDLADVPRARAPSSSRT